MKSCCGASNELLVSRFTCPENGVLAKKSTAARADDPAAWPRKSIGIDPAGAFRASTSAGKLMSLRMLRRV